MCVRVCLHACVFAVLFSCSILIVCVHQAIGSLAGNSMHVRALAAAFCAIFEAAKKVKNNVLHDSVDKVNLKGVKVPPLGLQCCQAINFSKFTDTTGCPERKKQRKSRLEPCITLQFRTS